MSWVFNTPKLSLAQLLILLWSWRASSAATCYDARGNAKSDLYPCDTSADVSPCCSSNDFCLSNGLCLNAGGNNGLSQQGCTSKGWDSPCVNHCPGEIGSTSDGFLYMMLCSSYDPAGENPLCCGRDYSCCNSTENIITTITRFSTMSRPAGAPTTSTSSSTVTTTSASSNTPSTSSTSTAAPTSQATNSGVNAKSLAVGLGVGIPLGLAFIAALAFLGWQIRKQNKLKETAIASSSQINTPNEVEYIQPYRQELHDTAVARRELDGTSVEPLKRAVW